MTTRRLIALYLLRVLLRAACIGVPGVIVAQLAVPRLFVWAGNWTTDHGWSRTAYIGSWVGLLLAGVGLAAYGGVRALRLISQHVREIRRGVHRDEGPESHTA